MSNTLELHTLDLFTGMGGFHVAAQRNGYITNIAASEIDNYNIKFIDRNLNLENAGDITNIAIERNNHPHQEYMDEDLVPCEQDKMGFTSLTMQDFYEDIVEWPDIITGGFPCQNLSSANVQDTSGITGDKSGLVYEQLRIIQNLEPDYCIFENSPKLIAQGLDKILIELNEMGYIVEYETIAATGFGYPHYRHRCYVVAYLPTSKLSLSGLSAFKYVRERAQVTPDERIPLIEGNETQISSMAVVEDPKSIKLRSKRLNSIGNAVIPDIPEAIFDVITEVEQSTPSNKSIDCPRDTNETLHSKLVAGKWVNIQEDSFMTDLFSEPLASEIKELPAKGRMCQGVLSTGTRNYLVNPKKNKYPGLYPTPISRDGNNNFSCLSRLSRPGGLGGVVGYIMEHCGVRSGGLNPEFSEQLMGYEKNYSKLK